MCCTSKLNSPVLQSADASFPFEFYTISFTTFSGEVYNGYTKKLKTILLDNSTIGNEYALNDFISTIYGVALNQVEQLATKHSYGTSKAGFKLMFLPHSTISYLTAIHLP